MLRNFGVAAHAAGATHLKGLPRIGDLVSSPTATRPYQVVEFDGHRLDIRLKVIITDPMGFEHEFEIERVWLLVIIDVCTRAVLGYNLVLGREYSRYDVIKTIEKALEPHRSRIFTIPGLSYGPQEGFPSERLLELGYATWEWIKLDNAKANLANETLSALCEFVGAVSMPVLGIARMNGPTLNVFSAPCIRGFHPASQATPDHTRGICGAPYPIQRAAFACMSRSMNWRS